VSLSPLPDSLADVARREGFPTFVQALRRWYLRLLRAPVPTPLWIVETSVAVSPAPEAEALALLRFGNWRMVLVGAAAMLAGAASAENVQRAWEALDRGSWVAPQLAAVLLLVDGAFEPEARARLLQALDLPGVPAAGGSAYRLPPQAARRPSRWKPTKALASLAAAYRRAPNADRGLLDQLDALDQAGELDAEGALALTEEWLGRVVAGAPPAMRARWRWAPA
jgi:hypothetical protein